MEKVFFVPGNTSALDYAREREDGVFVSYFTGKTLAELQEQYPGAIMGTEAEFTEQMEAACRTAPESISAEQYADALEALPPQDWQGIGSQAESFKCLERYAGRITSIYARVGCSHYRFHDICTLGHAEIIQKVQAITAGQYQEPKQPGYVCDLTGRVAVLVSVYAESELNGDAAAYLFSRDAEAMNLECWRMIEGIDVHLNGDAFEIWFTDGGFKTVGPDMTIFLSAQDAERLGQCN